MSDPTTITDAVSATAKAAWDAGTDEAIVAALKRLVAGLNNKFVPTKMLMNPDAWCYFWSLNNPSLARIADAGTRNWIFTGE